MPCDHEHNNMGLSESKIFQRFEPEITLHLSRPGYPSKIVPVDVCSDCGSLFANLERMQNAL